MVWSRSQSNTEGENPFDVLLGEEDERDVSPPTIVRSFNWAPFRKFLGPLLLLGFTGLTIFVLGLFRDSEVALHIVYVEIKALDDSGHPIAGAQVKFGDRGNGMTDAFGEWRRYLKLPAGEKVAVKIVKEGPRNRLVGGRTLVVPHKKANDREPVMKARVRLVPTGKLKRAKALYDPDSGHTRTVSKMAAEDHSKISVAFEKPWKRLSDRAMHFQKRVEDKILPSLKRRFKASGLGVGPQENIRLALTYIPDRGRPGLVHADVTWHHEGKWASAKFLRNFSKTADHTARDIIRVFRAYVPKSFRAYKEKKRWFALPATGAPKFWQLSDQAILTDGLTDFPLRLDPNSQRYELMVDEDSPCQNVSRACEVYVSTLERRPPNSGWRKLKVRFSPVLPDGAEVFVAGFQATPQGSGLWEFWGAPGQKMKLTVLRGKKIIGKQRVRPRSKAPSLVILPTTTVAYR